MKFDYIPSKIYVDQKAIYDNLKVVRNLHPTKDILAVVKADAYGHGIENVCEPAIKAGAVGFCVAYVDEARMIRKLGYKELILVLGASEVQASKIAQKENISLTAPSLKWLKEALKNLDPASSKKLKVHLALDTGMGRIGVTTLEELKKEIKFIEDNDNLFELEGIFTHFATADEGGNYYNYQKNKFVEMVKDFKDQVKYLHCENSAAGLIESEDDFTNTIRLGIALYGISPFLEKKKVTLNLKPALSLKSQISFIKEVPKGTKISYGATYSAPDDEYIATVSIGYADGWLRRMQGFKVIIDGKFCQNVGRITMDQLMVRVPQKFPIGTEVVLIGEEGKNRITAEEAADFAGTIPYEILTTLSKRVPRIAVNPVN
ncbi:alanine racemase [Xylocopilactobacillus apis]|uniref:Alanine racemase n=1 Tax=Xylocopilactobacillus apis TaxID=2932183 RepID=A0AAU9DRF5_9LACO|nr:alanine racemase [Xylocopilactobacillus apis]BDR56238.1 alanine racemase [Xylocopilactobacillus apis]